MTKNSEQQTKLYNPHHFKKILFLALPTVLSAILTFFVEIINVAFIGHLNDSYMLSGVGLGNMMVNALWVSVYMGINGALETLVS
jgi:MATE family multidrug resistance protein